MFTKADYDTYFGQLARIERKMIYRTYDLSLLLDEPSLVGVLKKIGDDEVRHYGYLLKMFRHLEDSKEIERRLETREHSLGTIRLRDPERRDGEMNAYCVNLSKTGICLECEKDISPSLVWDLAIQLFDKKEMVLRRGKVVWNKQVEPDFYICGIVFTQS